MQNFQEIADTFLANGAAIRVQNERELEDTVLSLIARPGAARRLGAAARALVLANRGAKDKTMAAIAGVLPPDYAADGCRAAVPHSALNLLSAAYGQLAQARRAWFTHRPHAQRRLPVPGGPASATCRWGAAARRPTVASLAQAAAGRQVRPVVLSRGYARRRSASMACWS